MAVVAVALAVPAAVVSASSSEQSRRACGGSAAPTLALTVRLRSRPGPMLLAGRTLWVGINGVRPGRPGRLLRLDAQTGRVLRSFRLPVDPLRLAAGFGSLWLTGQGGDRRFAGVLRLDPRTGRVTAVVRRRLGLGTALATTAHAVWVGGPDRFPPGHPERSGVYFVYKIDPRSNTVARRFRLRSTVIDLVGERRSLWVAGWYAIVRLSESGRVLLRQPVTGSAWSIALAGDGVWAAHTFYGTRRSPGVPPAARELFRIRDRSSPRLTVVDLEASPWQVSSAKGVVWVARGEFSRAVERLRDARPPAPLGTVAIPGIVIGLQATADGAWVAQLRPNQLDKIC
jgi:hypothetical protein